MWYTMEALVLFSMPEAEQAEAGTTKKAAAPTAPFLLPAQDVQK